MTTNKQTIFKILACFMQLSYGVWQSTIQNFAFTYSSTVPFIKILRSCCFEHTHRKESFINVELKVKRLKFVFFWLWKMQRNNTRAVIT